MSAPQRFEVSVTRTIVFTIVIEASSPEEAIELADELYDTDNSGFDDNSTDDHSWSAEPV